MLARLLVLLGALVAAGAVAVVPLLAAGPYARLWAPLAYMAVVAAVDHRHKREVEFAAQ